MGLPFCAPALRCTPSRCDRPEDVQGCPAAPEEFTATAFLVLLQAWGLGILVSAPCSAERRLLASDMICLCCLMTN